jgi:nucleotide-binding universal stress UspA family protein
MDIHSANYLVPVDFTPAAVSATRFAIELAKNETDHIILLHIIGNESDRHVAQMKMDQFSSEFEGSVAKLSTKIVAGSLATEIENVTKILEIDLIVMGTHCITGLGKMFRSHAFKIVEKVSVPLIIVQKEASFKAIKKIVMTIDLERESVQILRMVSNLSRMFNSEIILVAQETTSDIDRQRQNINLQVCNKVLSEQNIQHKIVFVDGKDFVGNIFKLCVEEGADLLAATYYQQHVHIFTESFVQTLAYNDLHIPLLTMDVEGTHAGSSFSAMGG